MGWVESVGSEDAVSILDEEGVGSSVRKVGSNCRVLSRVRGTCSAILFYLTYVKLLMNGSKTKMSIAHLLQQRVIRFELCLFQTFL